ncbi:WecB/TagA/CpsF family glycosyltransferase [Aureliella helgolandensis]|uniref:N-acetylmannosaminyltransferase n=1 Tax=Aureliella helgolandensis TaxID=2527968 RepID=A0A518G207_9BACT|nr:WecB/TagA/CpsF family glycosyltransferase [Aureliella helgolandensis]QDV22612.1 Putative N-acetylmannosaminyltransferase [Aureliella helgolandensis]
MESSTNSNSSSHTIPLPIVNGSANTPLAHSGSSQSPPRSPRTTTTATNPVAESLDRGIDGVLEAIQDERRTGTRSNLTWPTKVPIWNGEFSLLNMTQTVALADAVIQAGHPEYFVTANLNYLMLTEEHPRLEEINRRSIAVLADGRPIVARSRVSETPLPERVAGADLIVELARLSAEKGYRIYFLGAAPGVAQTAAHKLQEQFPQLEVAGCYAPPFRPLTAAEHEQMLEQIREAKPDILLVAFGQPKGEMWIANNRETLGVPLSIQLGASFDFLAGTAKRAPLVWQKIGCEWLYRALSDPRRLGPRYLKNIAFLLRKIAGDLASVLKLTFAQ